MAFSVKHTNLLPEILPKNTSEPSSFARVSSTIALQIFSMIENRKKIFVLSAVCRTFRELTKDEVFWKDLLFTDFGNKIAFLASSTNNKILYKQKYLEVKKFLDSLINSHLLMSEVTRLKSENTPYVKYGGHIIGNLGVYLNSLHMAQFSEVFHKCAQFDFCPLIERMVIHPTFNRIPTSALLSVIEIAAKNGQVKALTFIMNAPRAKELDREAKRQAFESAALEGQKEALQTLLS